MKQESSIDPVELKKLMDADFSRVHRCSHASRVRRSACDAGQNRPMESIHATDLQGASQDPAKPIYLICRSGNRSSKVCRQLGGGGAERVECERGDGCLDRRWASGGAWWKGHVVRKTGAHCGWFLGLAGVVLSRFFNPYLCALSAFVGAGLMIAGLTNWCGMGLLLLKIP